MAIVNIRGTSGSGKSTLIHWLLADYPHVAITAQMGPWKKPRVMAYRVFTETPTFIVGSYHSQCGGCDSLSYKGSHPDIEEMVRREATFGNVIFEGLTVSSTYTRWLGISHDFPGQFWWGFMATELCECHERILIRSNGRDPKRDKRGMADYQRKHRGCLVQRQRAIDDGEQVIDLLSDDIGYAQLLTILGESYGERLRSVPKMQQNGETQVEAVRSRTWPNLRPILGRSLPR